MVRTAAPALRQAHAGPDSDAASPAASECGAASLAPSPCTATDSREAWSGVGEFLDKATRVFADPAPCMAVLVVQIAGFDQLQVEHGLRNGELISNCVRDTLETQLRGCAVTRLASHQFAAAVRQPDRDHLRSFCAALLEPLTALSIPLGHGRTGVQLGIGAALLETEGTTPAPTRVESALDLGLATAVRLADAASSRFELVGGSLDAEVPESESGRVLTQVNRAIETNAFRLLFQPIISLRDDASEHYEAFLRMVDESGEEVRPDAFLDTAIANGVAGKIDRWVILNAIKALLGHRAQGNGTRMTISITANSIADPDFGAWLGVALKAARLPSDAIIFQISERDIRSMARQAQSFVQSLRELHCQTTLARFGGSDDAFEQLKHLAVDYVKLDGTLIEKLGADPAARAQVAQTLHRLQQLGKLSIVPKVETAAMLSALWQGGANFVQGNYLQPPRPEMDFEFQHFSA
jgi:EAL domain-containing protein (putative c-di-GMP-specific phosphodiesterase class I)/GGDEF domain-containing protein